MRPDPTKVDGICVLSLSERSSDSKLKLIAESKEELVLDLLRTRNSIHRILSDKQLWEWVLDHPISGGALPASDNFNGAEGAELTTYSANWTYNTGASFLIVSNAVRPNAAGDFAAHWNADAFNANQYSQGTIAALVPAAYIGVSVRCAASASTYYGYESNADDAAYLFKSVAGALTTLGTGDVFAVADVVRIQASGTTITPMKNGAVDASIGAQSDNAIASGSAGLAGAGNDSGSRLDSWSADNLAVAGRTPNQIMDLMGVGR